VIGSSQFWSRPVNRWDCHACRDRAAKDTENAIQQAHEDNHSGKAMEVLLTQAKTKGTHFCEGMPLVPTLEEVTKMLRLKARTSAAAATLDARRPRVRSGAPQDRCDGDLTFFLGNGEKMRLSDGHTNTSMNAIGFFLYTQCDDNIGDLWPATMGAFIL
jgi:hypothetical protein